ncbi:hypothetical protein DEIPH_ctg008orf0159 [Deinococcus phoenicis]|uniref:Uncharacterized protein n=1 Tax=Deinococcus phoenicis TaxID=1476583 RepID=A0A016QU56_9DEIO|nr:hypothetical protein [Deinococcus phoenicis]EYB69422.1 hypothetical protein DEIPH_ctg008orf0159 [Deinococcus phoenicis]
MTAPHVSLRPVVRSTVRRGRGFRILRRVQLHPAPVQRPSFWPRLWTLVWSGGDLEQLRVRQQQLAALEASLASRGGFR